MKASIIWVALVVGALLSGRVAACDAAAAHRVMGMIQSMAASVGTERDGRIGSVRWGGDFNYWSKDQQLQMAKTYADADACLSARAREIRFYSPSGQLSAIASPDRGIRLAR